MYGGLYEGLGFSFRGTCRLGYMKVHGFLLGTRVGKVLGVRVFRVTCRAGYIKV